MNETICKKKILSGTGFELKYAGLHVVDLPFSRDTSVHFIWRIPSHFFTTGRKDRLIRSNNVFVLIVYAYTVLWANVIIRLSWLYLFT